MPSPSNQWTDSPDGGLGPLRTHVPLSAAGIVPRTTSSVDSVSPSTGEKLALSHHVSLLGGSGSTRPATSATDVVGATVDVVVLVVVLVVVVLAAVVVAASVPGVAVEGDDEPSLEHPASSEAPSAAAPPINPRRSITRPYNDRPQRASTIGELG